MAAKHWIAYLFSSRANVEKRGKTWNLILNLKGETWKNVEKRGKTCWDFEGFSISQKGMSPRFFPLWGAFVQHGFVHVGHGGGGSRQNRGFYPKSGGASRLQQRRT